MCTATEIKQLVQEFSERTLPKESWTHEAHLIVGLWHNWHFSFEEALPLVRKKIIVYNESVGTENSDSSGYHETMTVFWMTVTKQYLETTEEVLLTTSCNTFLQSEQASKNWPFRFYTRERLFSVKARKNWVEPDLKSFQRC